LALNTRRTSTRFALLLITLACGSTFLQAVTPIKKKKGKARPAVSRMVEMNVVAKRTPVAASLTTRSRTKKTTGKLTGMWRVPNYADSTEGDFIDGEDLAVRRAAVDALGRLNGTVVVTDPSTGRVLTMVNQKLALQSGYQPCSTVKVPVALAALDEGIVDRQTAIRVYGRTTFTLTTALAKSSNQYFASLGQRLGFDRVTYYARLFGLGEKAGLDIEGEQAGILPATVPKSGMGMMTSFGDGISLTPLELAALMGAIANGGTLYYLQYPRARRKRRR
jgi:penicillin-binding protein 2